MPGTVGIYDVSRTLGTGASCKVKLGRNSQTGEKVAIKFMNQGNENLTENEI
jgi:serine/threonine protein kinase